MGQTGQQLLTATEKNIEIWVWTENLVFYSGYNASNLFLTSMKEVLMCMERDTLKTERWQKDFLK